MINTIAIYDFDGTLVDSSHRYRTQIVEGVERIDLQYWIEREHLATEDRPLPLMQQFDRDCDSKHTFAVVATARIWCEATEQFCSAWNVKPNAVVSRRDRNDCRGGAALKIAGINSLMNLKQFAKVKQIRVYEDNISYLKEICDYYRQKGFDVVGTYIPSDQGH